MTELLICLWSSKVLLTLFCLSKGYIDVLGYYIASFSHLKTFEPEIGSEEQNKLQEKRRAAEKKTMPFPLKRKADTNMLFIKIRCFLLREDKTWGKREKNFKLELISDATIKY